MLQTLPYNGSSQNDINIGGVIVATNASKTFVDTNPGAPANEFVWGSEFILTAGQTVTQTASSNTYSFIVREFSVP